MIIDSHPANLVPEEVWPPSLCLELNVLRHLWVERVRRLHRPEPYRLSAAQRQSSLIASVPLQLGCFDGRLKRQFKHLVDRHHGVEVHLLADLFGNVVKVAAVAFRQDHVGQPGGMGGERLLLQSADRQSSPI